MKAQVAYCSACDRDVHVVLTEDRLLEGQANLPDPEIVCLEIGNACTGSMCPIGAQPPSVMAARLVRSGLGKPVLQPVVLGACELCLEVTQFVVIDPKYVTCTQCGTTTTRASLATPTSN